MSARLQQRLADRLQDRLLLSDVEIDRLDTYLGLLAKWNQTVNLTALQLDPLSDGALDRLVVIPLLAAQFVSRGSVRWFDVGSGAGSPAVPLKIVRPAAALTLIESKNRKAAFLREVIRELSLESADVEASRFDEVAQAHRSSASLISVQAVRVDAGFLASAVDLAVPGGQLLWFGVSTAIGSETCGFRLLESAQLLGPDSRVAVLSKTFHVEQSD
jgi:16S rRNA (guanine527-N7)-methyltransferase